jgi:hypothetical protein
LLLFLLTNSCHYLCLQIESEYSAQKTKKTRHKEPTTEEIKDILFLRSYCT